MDRRKFLLGSAAASVAATASVPRLVAETPAVATSPARTMPAILADYSADDHRRRLDNIALCQQSIRRCMRSRMVTDYLPGQCCYNLGEYPCRKPWDPDDWDEQELDRLHGEGIRLIQVHEEWNDAMRLFGGDKFTPVNPAGFRRFVDMVHRRGMKIIPYISTLYFQRTDPDFHRDWAPEPDFVGMWIAYAQCSAASPGWRAYMLPRIMRILDDYGVDGFYIDGTCLVQRQLPVKNKLDEPAEYAEPEKANLAVADLTALIYAEVKRRGGIMKVHSGASTRPPTDMKVYDYLWVGECVDNGEAVRQTTKDFPPYLVPCPDLRFAKPENEDEIYLSSIPYMQFPLLLAGRPFTGERCSIPGVPCLEDDGKALCDAIWKHYQSHPNGPFCYNWWDSVTGRPSARPTYARWLKQYLPMVEEGTWAWLEIADSDLTVEPPPKDVCVSAFANRELYLAIANYGRNEVTLTTNDAYVSTDGESAPGKQWTLPARSLKTLRRA